MKSIKKKEIKKDKKFENKHIGLAKSKVVATGKVEMPLIDRYNTSYIGEIYFGTPAQKIRALFDTGSANCWVFSETAKKELPAKIKAHRKFYSYNPAKSSTAGKPNDSSRCRIGFGSGWLKGLFTTDTVTLGNPSTPSKDIIVKNFTFGKVYQ